jgi:hypothetical protein
VSMPLYIALSRPAHDAMCTRDDTPEIIVYRGGHPLHTRMRIHTRLPSHPVPTQPPLLQYLHILVTITCRASRCSVLSPGSCVSCEGCFDVLRPHSLSRKKPQGENAANPARAVPGPSRSARAIGWSCCAPGPSTGVAARRSGSE